VSFALILAGGIIVIGFLGNYLFKRTGLPDMLFLIILGLLIGPVTGLVDGKSLMSFAPYLAVLALVFILFDGGMTLNIYRVFSESPRAVVLAVIGFIASAAATSLIMAFVVFPKVLPLYSSVSPLYSILFGTILGGGSSTIVVSLVSNVEMNKKGSSVLALESVMNDILCIVLSLVLIEMIVLRANVDLPTVAKSVASRLSIGAVLGAIIGIGWLSTLKRVAKVAYSYMLTLGVVLLAYAFSEYLGGSGALCALLFGIIMGNEKEIYGILKTKKPAIQAVDAGMKRFESEMAFLLRTFFFVYLGLIATMTNTTIIITGILLSFTLLLIRFGAVRLATVRSELTQERTTMSMLLTRGLAAAVLATLPLQFADPIKYPDIGGIFQQLSPLYINVAIVVILTTSIIAASRIVLLKRRDNKATS
jgi:cell volume regulation protein A